MTNTIIRLNIVFDFSQARVEHSARNIHPFAGGVLSHVWDSDHFAGDGDGGVDFICHVYLLAES
jgi:hypothetical protein